MYSATHIAQFFLNKDPNRKVFDKELREQNGRRFYKGNARLNKYLHIAQNLYIAMTGQPLFEEHLYAFDNGAVVPSVQENYAILYAKPANVSFPAAIETFLNKVYKLLENASLDELIQLSHEDSEWIKKHVYYGKADQRMDSMAHLEEYKEQYRDVLRVMEGMTL